MKSGLITLLCLGIGLGAGAQSLGGKVFSTAGGDREILPGATLVWLGTTTGATANENGVFSLPLRDITDRRIVVSAPGHITDTVRAGDKAYLSILLRRDKAYLDEVLVRDRQAAYLSSLSAVKTEVINQRELTKAACCDLAGCFGTQATVQPQTTNVITNAQELRILGLSGVYNQVLFDGMPVFQGLTYTYGISSYPGTLVENIFVSKGAASVLQGYESISGQINVEPRNPDKAERLLANAYINSFGEKHFNLNLAGKAGKAKKWSTLLAFHTVQPAGRTDGDDDGFLDLPLLTRYMVFNRWKRGNDRLRGLYFNAGLRFLHEQRTGGQVAFNGDTDRGSDKVYGQSVRYTQPEAYIKTGYRFNDGHALSLAVSAFGQDQQSYFGTVRYDAVQSNLNLNLQHEWLWRERHLLKYGLSYRHQDLDETIAFTGSLLPRTYAGRYRTPQRVAGVFAENAFHWMEDKLVWITGARMDHHQDFGWFFTPRTMLRLAPGRLHTIRASAGTGWRQVNVFSEHMNLLAGSRDIIFREPLRPEQGFNWGLNYTYRISAGHASGTVSADFYQTRFSNQFYPDYDTDPGKAYIANFTGDSRSNGIQVEANIKLYEVLELRAAWNYLDVYRLEGGAKQQLPFNPRHRLMGAVSYRPAGDRWYFDLNAHWYDRQRLPSTAANPEQYRNPDYSRPYATLNAQITWKRRGLEVYGGCENIFNFRQYRPITSWQDPFSGYFDVSSVWGPTRGREFYLGLRWKYRQAT